MAFWSANDGQGRNLRREIVVARSLSADRRDRKDQVAHVRPVLDAAAFSEKKDRLGLDGAQEVHHGRRVRASHAEVDDRDLARRRGRHRLVAPVDGHLVGPGEQVHVPLEIGEEDVVAELLQRHTGVAREPVLHDLLAGIKRAHVRRPRGRCGCSGAPRRCT